MSTSSIRTPLGAKSPALFCALLIGGFVVGLTTEQESADAGDKITICHFPPGNPANFQTITVGSQKAADKHMEKHGDLIGPCCELDDICDDENACTAEFCLDDGCMSEPVDCGELPCMVLTGCDPQTGCQYEDVACDPGEVCDPETGFCEQALQTCNFVQTGDDATPQSQAVSVGCTVSLLSVQLPVAFILEVDVPTAILAGSAFTATLDGVGLVPEPLLDQFHVILCGQIRQLELSDFVSTVQVRSGATGPDVTLSVDLATLVPGPTRFCNSQPPQICAADGDCFLGVCNPPIFVVDYPVIEGTPNSPGGCIPEPGCQTVDCDCSACDALGPAKATQCADTGSCVSGPLMIELGEEVASYTAAATGPVLWGWSDGVGVGTTPVPDLFLCPTAAPNCQDAFMPDGCYDIPGPVTSPDPAPPIGIRLSFPPTNAFSPAIQCAQGEPGGICASGEGCLVDGDCATEPCTLTPDVICPTPDANLIACPVN